MLDTATVAALAERRAHPAVTVVLRTQPGARLHPDDRFRLDDLLAGAARRLSGDPTITDAAAVEATLRTLAEQAAAAPVRRGLVLAVAGELARSWVIDVDVRERVVVDDTVATRDLLADLLRRQRYQMLAVSERLVRRLVGDADGLVEQRDELFPLERQEDERDGAWRRRVVAAYDAVAAGALGDGFVVAGAGRLAIELARERGGTPIWLRGGHDRTSPGDLHRRAWPLIERHQQARTAAALDELQRARQARRYAGGVSEVWDLAREGRVELVVAERGHELPARLGVMLEPASDREAPDVVDDVVDELFEAVLRIGGRVVLVDDGTLAEAERIAAVVRW